ncbi:uncharacterized protein LOC129892905 [Solanum dulcamara]|uniref:uncharacterized protein LOC129892905 n=1 Tax=Solanum dulcamara TaxID=45834 RepID=UPI002485A149|nr:uncharacterized protein LOC129892905 [Solanum dulcamara]
MDEILGGMPITKKVFIGVDFNGHIGSTPSGFDNLHGDSDFGVRNFGETSFLDFSRAYELVIANSCFSKKDDHLIIFRSALTKSQIYYLLMWKGDNDFCKDYKVISSQNLTTQHKLLVMDLNIKRGRRNKKLYVWPMIK